MSARELRAEARAWRRAAEMCAESDFVKLRDATDADECCARCGKTDDRLTRRLRERLHAHWSASRIDPFDSGIDENFRVLACLFLALECEDEGRALGRGETPDRRSAR